MSQEKEKRINELFEWILEVIFLDLDIRWRSFGRAIDALLTRSDL